MAPSQPGMTIHDVWRVVKKRFWLMAAIVAFVLLLTIGVTWAWATWYPSYRAQAFIEVKSPNAPQAMKPDVLTGNKDIMQQYMNTQSSMIQSREILAGALEAPEIKATSWYTSFDNTDDMLVDMSERVDAGTLRNTYFIDMGFTWRNRRESMQIANAILYTYWQKVTTEAKAKTTNELAEYNKRAETLRNQQTEETNSLERFRTSKNIPLIQQRRVTLGDHVTALTRELTEAETEKDEAQALYDMYSQPGAMARMTNTPEMRQMIQRDYLVAYYTNQLADLQIQLDLIKERGLRHLAARRIEQRMEKIQEQVNKKKVELTTNLFLDMQERTYVQLDAVTTKVLGLQNRLLEAKNVLDDLERELFSYLELEREVQALRDQLRDVEDYILKLRIQLENPELVRVRIVSYAMMPLQRSSPQWKINIPAGLFLGVFLAGALAFLLEFVSATVKTPADVVRQLNMPLLGQLPSQDDDESSPADMNRLLTDAPHSVLAEAFRQLRTNFLFCAPAEKQRSILITSCSPSEGKTCISVNLATSLALAGSKVLLIDANFRRPQITETFRITNGAEGLSNVLIGHANPESLIHKTQHENLDVLPAGPLPPNPAELLGSAYLKDFMQKLSSVYRTIIFDGPPLLVVSDAQVLSAATDGVILVVRAGLCARGTIQRAREQLRRVDAKLLGVVLNDVRVTRGGYFREMYRTYYDYQSQAVLPSGEDRLDATSETAKT